MTGKAIRRKNNTKVTILLLLLALIPITASGQFATSNDGLYRIAFEKFASQIDSFYNKYGSSEDWKVIYLREGEMLDSIPKTICGRSTVIVTSLNRDSIYKANGNHFREVVASPIYIKGNQASIVFTPWGSKRIKKHRVSMIISDWTTTNFKYDCYSNKWVYTTIENGGI